MRKRKQKSQTANRLMLGAAVLLLSYSTLTASPALLITGTPTLLANAVVGMSAGVAANPDNTLAKQLAEKAAELESRESRLLAQESGTRDSSTLQNTMAMYSFALSAFLFVLVAMNYLLDWRRSRRSTASAA